MSSTRQAQDDLEFGVASGDALVPEPSSREATTGQNLRKSALTKANGLSIAHENGSVDMGSSDDGEEGMSKSRTRKSIVFADDVEAGRASYFSGPSADGKIKGSAPLSPTSPLLLEEEVTVVSAGKGQGAGALPDVPEGASLPRFTLSGMPGSKSTTSKLADPPPPQPTSTPGVPKPKSTHDHLPLALSQILKTAEETKTTVWQLTAQVSATAPFHNPFAASASARAQQRKESQAQMQARRMSLGAALCIPAPSRIDQNMSWRKLFTLSAGALGIVYGEISVSPLYVLKAIFAPHGGELTDDGDYPEIPEEEILGTISILVWLVTLVCCIKYVWLILKADRTGEGGIWALLSLIPLESLDASVLLHRSRAGIYVLGLLAASFLVVDTMISPAITVLSAFEGIRLYSKATFSQDAVVACTCTVLAIVFWWQRFGTSRIQKASGAIFALWYLVIAMIGLYQIARYPKVLAAWSPHYIGYMVRKDVGHVATILGEAVLAVAGVEAMYADLGHFSAKPIRWTFLGMVYPAITLNYLGQAAYLIGNPAAAENPFFKSIPNVVDWPVMVLATIAAILAAQGAISGCFNLIDQSISLNKFPNVITRHLKHAHGSDIYIPAVNFCLFLGSVIMASAFHTSQHLSYTAGICVAGSMAITSFLYVLVMHHAWNLPKWKILLFGSIYLPLDLLLFVSSLRKIVNEGWVSLLLAFMVFTIMFVWTATTQEISTWLREQLITLNDLRVYVKSMPRVPGTLVFVSSGDEDVPNVLRICAGRLNNLPVNLICMSAVASQSPFVADEEKVVFRTVDAVSGIYRLVISYGYAERDFNVQTALERAKKRGLRMKAGEKISFIVGREIVHSTISSRLFGRLRRQMYNTIARNLPGKMEYFDLPPGDTLEVMSGGTGNVVRFENPVSHGFITDLLFH
ncbi:potassium transporter-domain-containing protein [Fimicolochytrium jonesii]|uniref:potassium transporter-domain-containing protein n=1 Tax=Fimicolochytrium jonesii TaxID=1396493 RepID=UPI0022FE8A6D|nr:potassium transporter-domain-containing protein [Fimicolochytrium jonesii]KAI8819244.1 potassium transporter-domain-containing protein [Fimicolochytrium jonesii]